MLALIAMFTSVIGASLACQNVATRMWFGMGRAGALPAAFARCIPRARRRRPPSRRSSSCRRARPDRAAVDRPANAFILTVGYMLVIGVIFVYIMANVGVIHYFWTQRRAEFNWILHFVFPVGTSAVLIYSLDKSFNPLPALSRKLGAVARDRRGSLLGIVILGVLQGEGRRGLDGEGGPDRSRRRPETVAEAAAPAGGAGSVMPACYPSKVT